MANLNIKIHSDDTDDSLGFEGGQLNIQSEVANESTVVAIKGNCTGKGAIEIHDTAATPKILRFEPADTMSESTTYTWPASHGLSDYVLSTDGSGNLSWSPAQGGGTVYSQQSGAPTDMAQNDSETVTHPSLATKEGMAAFTVLEYQSGTPNQTMTDIISEASSDRWDYMDVKGTAAKFEVDTADTSGHFEDSANNPVGIGSGNTEPKIQAGCRLKINDNNYLRIHTVTGTGSAANSVEFVGTASAAVHTVTGVYGSEIVGEVLELSYGVDNDSVSDLVPRMTRNDSPEGLVESDSQYGNAYAAFRAFDNKSNKYWRNESANKDAAWLSYTFEEAQIVIQYNIMPENTDCAPKDWTFDAWDGSQWTTLDTRTGQTSWTTGQTVSYAGGDIADNTTPYIGYRIHVTDNNGGAYVEIREMEYIGPDSSPVYPVNEYYTATTNNTGQLDSTNFTDVNYGVISEVLDSQNAFYAVSFDGRTTWKIFNAGGVWRSIARDNSGTWQYNNDATDTASESWVNATVNNMQYAIGQAIGAQTPNQMDGDQYVGITDTEWNATGGFDTSQTTLDFALILESTSSTTTPEVDNISLNYDIGGRFMAMSIGTFTDAEFHVERLTDTTTRFTKKHSGSSADVYCTVITPG